MVKRERINKDRERLIFLWLVLFPLGQIPRLFLGMQLMDVTAVLILVLELAGGREKYADWFRRYGNFIYVCIFSLVFSWIFWGWKVMGTGGLYLLRLTAYGYLAYSVNCLVRERELIKEKLFNAMMVVGATAAVIGWMQYLLIPDLTGLKYFGWDDHYYRLVGSFLDPAFTGIISVMTFVMIMGKYFKQRKLRYLAAGVILVETVAFTYSRASILSLAAVLGYWAVRKKERVAVVLLGLLVMGVALLPKPGGEGVKLTRDSTIWARINNYNEGITIIEKSPVFGIGFNNLCLAKEKWLGENELRGHSCSGLDNSILVIWATTGIVGLLVGLDVMCRIIKTTDKSDGGEALRSVLMAVAVHGLFTNTYFYAWVMGWVAILVGISRLKIRESN